MVAYRTHAPETRFESDGCIHNKDAFSKTKKKMNCQAVKTIPRNGIYMGSNPISFILASCIYLPEKFIWYGHPTHIREVVSSILTSGTIKNPKGRSAILKYSSCWFLSFLYEVDCGWGMPFLSIYFLKCIGQKTLY